MAFINKMDILGANFYAAVDQIKNRLGKNAICLQLPIGKEEDFKGIIDLFEMEAYIYNDDKGEDISITAIPDDMKELQPWTGWNRKQSVVSQLLQLLQHVTGLSRKTASLRRVLLSTVSTSLIHQAT
jgi:translation elongation factor EF-G